MSRKTREQLRHERAEAVCRELRYQVAENRLNLPQLVEHLFEWMRVAKKNKYTRPNPPKRKRA